MCMEKQKHVEDMYMSMSNSAPEKIYLFENPVTETPDDRWLSKRSDDNDIEYTRTDALIKKACEWLENNLQGVIGGSIYTEDFRNYMEGE